MCSTKWARPRSLSCSNTEPALTTKRRKARFSGLRLARTYQLRPLSSLPVDTWGSRGSAGEAWVEGAAACVGGVAASEAACPGAGAPGCGLRTEVPAQAEKARSGNRSNQRFRAGNELMK